MDERGNSPVEQALNELSAKEDMKVRAYLKVLKEYGHTLHRPIAGYKKENFMANVSIKKAEHLLHEKDMSPEFRRGFQGEYAKLLLTQKIAEIRKKSHIDQKTLAHRLGVSQQVVSRIETGENSNLTIDTLSQLARALGHTVKISFHKASRKDAALRVV